jgi:hypothetical protein
MALRLLCNGEVHRLTVDEVTTLLSVYCAVPVNFACLLWELCSRVVQCAGSLSGPNLSQVFQAVGRARFVHMSMVVTLTHRMMHVLPQMSCVDTIQALYGLLVVGSPDSNVVDVTLARIQHRPRARTRGLVRKTLRLQSTDIPMAVSLLMILDRVDRWGSSDFPETLLQRCGVRLVSELSASLRCPQNRGRVQSVRTGTGRDPVRAAVVAREAMPDGAPRGGRRGSLSVATGHVFDHQRLHADVPRVGPHNTGGRHAAADGDDRRPDRRRRR